MDHELRFSTHALNREPLCTYDGTQESLDNCVAVMCKDLGIEPKEDGQYPGEMIMVALWARILRLEGMNRAIGD